MLMLPSGPSAKQHRTTPLAILEAQLETRHRRRARALLPNTRHHLGAHLASRNWRNDPLLPRRIPYKRAPFQAAAEEAQVQAHG